MCDHEELEPIKAEYHAWLNRVDSKPRRDEDDRECQCQACSWTGTEKQLQTETWDAITDIGERVGPGEVCPAGECPKCGSLATLHPKSGTSAALFGRGASDDLPRQDRVDVAFWI